MWYAYQTLLLAKLKKNPVQVGIMKFYSVRVPPSNSSPCPTRPKMNVCQQSAEKWRKMVLNRLGTVCKERMNESES
jgi:hypothetical protein